MILSQVVVTCTNSVVYWGCREKVKHLFRHALVLQHQGLIVRFAASCPYMNCPPCYVRAEYARRLIGPKLTSGVALVVLTQQIAERLTQQGGL
jgi:hypothetical protein